MCLETTLGHGVAEGQKRVSYTRPH